MKICGITSLADAELAVELGAWAVGMIFYEGSPRRCSIEEAQVIAATLRRRVELCGVFVNAPLEEIVRDSEELGLSMLQLHGDEGPSFCAEVRRRTGARVIKAVQVSGSGRRAGPRALPRRLPPARRSRRRRVARQGCAGARGRPSTGSSLRARRSKIPLILSGGLHAENVAEAIALARPFAVDSASGTEAAPGRKDPSSCARSSGRRTGAARERAASGAGRTIGRPA